MTALIGRERELATALSLFTTAETTPVARTLVVEGPSGVGKTAFLEALKEQNPEWIFVGTTAHRIQASFSQAVVHRLMARLSEVLGERAERYAAGENLMRFLEGVTLDHPVFIAVDDAQWIDEDSAETLSAIATSLANRPLVIGLMQRAEGDSPPGISFDQWITLGPLGDRAAAAVAHAHFRDGNDEVIAAIVAQSGGQPIDIVSLAQSACERGATTADEVADSMRSVAVRTIRALPAQLREFLQITSLLNDPIDYGLLHRLWPNDKELIELITAASERFLIQDGTHLRFSHAMLADAVLETIPVKIPLRRRVIDALSSAPARTIEDWLQIAEQAVACGDRDLAKKTLTGLALDAIARGDAHLTITVADRALAIGEPSNDDFVTLYSGHARALQFLGRLDRAANALQHALEEAVRRGIRGTAQLASQLVLAYWFDDQHERARQTYTEFMQAHTAPKDRMQLHAAGLWFAACDQDRHEYDQICHELHMIDETLPADLALRQQIVRAFMSVRSGEFATARDAVTQLKGLARMVPDALRNLGDFAEAQVDLHLLGAESSSTARLREQYREKDDGAFADHLAALLDILAGRYDHAALILEDGVARFTSQLQRRRMLVIAAAIKAMQGSTLHDRAIVNDLARLLTGERGGWLMPLAAWSAATNVVNDSKARILSRIVLEFLSRPTDPFIFAPITPIAVGAKMRNDVELLDLIASGDYLWKNASPLVSADYAVARAVANSSSTDEPFEQCRTLGLVALEHLAARTMSKQSAPQGRSPLTARERQIAEAISQGKSNREIADEYVLSERTIEGHVANIFNKLSVSSRTQIAAWFIKFAS